MTMTGIARLIANMMIAIEMCGEETMNLDDACQILEQAASDFRRIDTLELDQLTDAFNKIASEYSGEEEEFVRNIPAYFYRFEEDSEKQ